MLCAGHLDRWGWALGLGWAWRGVFVIRGWGCLGLCEFWPVEGVALGPVFAAAESTIAFAFDLGGQLHQPPLWNSVLQPGVYAGRLDVEQPRHAGDTTEQLDDFGCGHGGHR